jgi:hypothetical protein
MCEATQNTKTRRADRHRRRPRKWRAAAPVRVTYRDGTTEVLPADAFKKRTEDGA